MDTSTSTFIIEMILGFFIGLILSWSVGLAPAIVYRYTIFKKPIEKKKVFWRLAPIVFVLMFVFKLTMAGLTGTDPNPNFIPWVIIYYIGKWIMTRKPNQRVSTSHPKTSLHPYVLPPRSVQQPQQVTLIDKGVNIVQKTLSILFPEKKYRCPECGLLRSDREKRCPECGNSEMVNNDYG